jgi:hypothetical protein
MSKIHRHDPNRDAMHSGLQAYIQRLLHSSAGRREKNTPRPSQNAWQGKGANHPPPIKPLFTSRPPPPIILWDSTSPGDTSDLASLLSIGPRLALAPVQNIQPKPCILRLTRLTCQGLLTAAHRKQTRRISTSECSTGRFGTTPRGSPLRSGLRDGFLRVELVTFCDAWRLAVTQGSAR